MKAFLQKKWLFVGLSLLVHLILLFFLVPYFSSSSHQSIRVHYVTLRDGILGGGDKQPDLEANKKDKKTKQNVPAAKTTSKGAQSEFHGASKTSSLSGEGSGDGGSDGGSEDVLKAIKRKILAAKRYPPMAKQKRAEGEVAVHFSIGADGKIFSSEISTSSGISVLDQEAMATLKRAQPYPVYAGPITMILKFRLNP